MKNLMWILSILLFSSLLISPAIADESGIKSTISINYWVSDVSKDGYTTDQSCFPAMTAVIRFMPEWALIAEYSAAEADTTDIGSELESERLLLGVRYDFKNDIYLTVAWNRIETEEYVPIMTETIESEGFVFGGGFNFHESSGSPWTVNIDFAFGFDHDLIDEVNVLGFLFDFRTKSDVILADVSTSYHFAEEGFKLNFGYEYLQVNHEPQVIGGTQIESTNYIFRGPYLGLGYDF